MITKILIENFKKFEKAEIELGHDTILFVGQNNGGKTTALQALSLWSFLAQQWQTKKVRAKPNNELERRFQGMRFGPPLSVKQGCCGTMAM